MLNNHYKNIEQVLIFKSKFIIYKNYFSFLPGCARTEGYYKVTKDEKIPRLKTSHDSQSSSILPQAILDTSRTTGAQMSRELRSEHRRNLLALGDAEFADHFKFSQLKVMIKH